MPNDTQTGVNIVICLTGLPLIVGGLVGYWLRGRVARFGWAGLLPLPASLLRRF